MPPQLYAMSLMVIVLDTDAAARYLHELAQHTGITPEQCNQIHAQLGAPSIYG